MGLIPLLEGADRDLLLEQCSRTCGGEAVLTHFALRTLAPHPWSGLPMNAISVSARSQEKLWKMADSIKNALRCSKMLYNYLP
jgi:hypothetical protein